MALYDGIGKKYNTNRTADPRLLEALKETLDLPIESERRQVQRPCWPRAGVPELGKQ